jgi:hypothetical protein
LDIGAKRRRLFSVQFAGWRSNKFLNTGIQLSGNASAFRRSGTPEWDWNFVDFFKRPVESSKRPIELPPMRSSMLRYPPRTALSRSLDLLDLIESLKASLQAAQDDIQHVDQTTGLAKRLG